MPIPTDPQLYEMVKRRIYTVYPTHSAYRSGRLVAAYKREFAARYPTLSPYQGARPARTSPGLRRWFAEKWRNQRGQVGYQGASDVYRPTRRISPQTPLTFNELSPTRIRAAQRRKRTTGRVTRF